MCFYAPKTTLTLQSYRCVASLRDEAIFFQKSIRFQCKTVSVNPDMNARCVVRQALHVMQNGGQEDSADAEGEGDNENEGRLGSPNDFTLYVRTTRDAPPTPLHGIERPHAVQVSYFYLR